MRDCIIALGHVKGTKGSDIPNVNITTEIDLIIKKSTSAQCELDPIPTSLVKRFLPSLLPVITAIINKSLELFDFPLKLKNALVKP